MSYTVFDKTRPDATTENGTQAMQSVRNNLLALRDAAVVGGMPGWNFSTAGGTPAQPGQIVYTKGTEILEITLTWGTTGGEAGNVTAADYQYSPDSGSTWDGVGFETVTYDSNGFVTATTWS